jgi:hypothetical protein
MSNLGAFTTGHGIIAEFNDVIVQEAHGHRQLVLRTRCQQFRQISWITFLMCCSRRSASCCSASHSNDPNFGVVALWKALPIVRMETTATLCSRRHSSRHRLSGAAPRLHELAHIANNYYQYNNWQQNLG